MTDAYAAFLADQRRSGPDNADGYAPGYFPLMTAQERSLAFAALVAQLPWHMAAEALFCIDPEAALRACNASLASSELAKHSPDFELLALLFKKTHDDQFLSKIFDGYPSGSTWGKLNAIREIGRIGGRPAREFFKRTVLVEENKEALQYVADAFLDACRVPFGSPSEAAQFDLLLAALQSRDFSERYRAVALVEANWPSR